MGVGYDWRNMRTHPRTRSNDNAISRTHNETDYVRIGPFNKNILRWHFSISGPTNSVYENGVYHGILLLPKNYPLTPPRVQMLTPNGRFITNVDICLSASNYHPETWTPQWTILSLVNALRLHMLTFANEIGGMMSTDERRRLYAKESRVWRVCYPGGNGDGAVVVDHVHMVASGIFTPSLTTPAIPTTEGGRPYDIEVNSSSCTQYLQSQSDLPVANIIYPQAKAGKSFRSAQANQMKSSIIHDGTRPYKGSKTAKAAGIANTGLQTGQELASKKAVTSGHHLESNFNGVYIRLMVAVLKLPLRVLSALLKVFGSILSCLRNIIDLFIL